LRVAPGYNATTGALNWTTQLQSPGDLDSPPTASNGVVYVSGGGQLYAVSETDGSVVGSQQVENGDNSSPALNASSVFVSYACGLVYSFDRTTGTEQWFSNSSCEGGGGKTPVVQRLEAADGARGRAGAGCRSGRGQPGRLLRLTPSTGQGRTGAWPVRPGA
jgi:hypothetical protein